MVRSRLVLVDGQRYQGRIIEGQGLDLAGPDGDGLGAAVIDVPIRCFRLSRRHGHARGQAVQDNPAVLVCDKLSVVWAEYGSLAVGKEELGSGDGGSGSTDKLLHHQCLAGPIAECQFVEVAGLDFDVSGRLVQHIPRQGPGLPYPHGGPDFQVPDGDFSVFVRHIDAVRGADGPSGPVRDVELATGQRGIGILRHLVNGECRQGNIVEGERIAVSGNTPGSAPGSRVSCGCASGSAPSPAGRASGHERHCIGGRNADGLGRGIQMVSRHGPHLTGHDNRAGFQAVNHDSPVGVSRVLSVAAADVPPVRVRQQEGNASQRPGTSVRVFGDNQALQRHVPERQGLGVIGPDSHRLGLRVPHIAGGRFRFADRVHTGINVPNDNLPVGIRGVNAVGTDGSLVIVQRFALGRHDFEPCAGQRFIRCGVPLHDGQASLGAVVKDHRLRFSALNLNHLRIGVQHITGGGLRLHSLHGHAGGQVPEDNLSVPVCDVFPVSGADGIVPAVHHPERSSLDGVRGPLGVFLDDKGLLRRVLECDRLGVIGPAGAVTSATVYVPGWMFRRTIRPLSSVV